MPSPFRFANPFFAIATLALAAPASAQEGWTAPPAMQPLSADMERYKGDGYWLSDPAPEDTERMEDIRRSELAGCIAPPDNPAYCLIVELALASVYLEDEARRWKRAEALADELFALPPDILAFERAAPGEDAQPGLTVLQWAAASAEEHYRETDPCAAARWKLTYAAAKWHAGLEPEYFQIRSDVVRDCGEESVAASIARNAAATMELAPNLAEDALATREATVGADDPALAPLVANLGWHRHLSGLHEEAAELLERALALFARDGGAVARDQALATQSALAEVEASLGLIDAAIERHRIARAARRSVSPEQDGIGAYLAALAAARPWPANPERLAVPDWAIRDPDAPVDYDSDRIAAANARRQAALTECRPTPAGPGRCLDLVFAVASYVYGEDRRAINRALALTDRIYPVDTALMLADRVPPPGNPDAAARALDGAVEVISIDSTRGCERARRRLAKQAYLWRLGDEAQGELIWDTSACEAGGPVDARTANARAVIAMGDDPLAQDGTRLLEEAAAMPATQKDARLATAIVANRALHLLAGSRYDEAEPGLRDALGHYPAGSSAALGLERELARLLLETGRTREARARLTALVDARRRSGGRDEELVRELLLLASTESEAETAQPILDEAIALQRALVAAEPDGAAIRLQEAQAERTMGMFRDSARDAVRLMRKDLRAARQRTLANALMSRGMSAFATGETAEAGALFEEAHTLDGRLYRAFTMHALAELSQGRFDKVPGLLQNAEPPEWLAYTLPENHPDRILLNMARALMYARFSLADSAAYMRRASDIVLARIAASPMGSASADRELREYRVVFRNQVMFAWYAREEALRRESGGAR